MSLDDLEAAHAASTEALAAAKEQADAGPELEAAYARFSESAEALAAHKNLELERAKAIVAAHEASLSTLTVSVPDEES